MLDELRQDDGTEQHLGYHQAQAHLSMAYTLAASPTGQGLYGLARALALPRTGFFDSHQDDITAELDRCTRPDLLDPIAEAKIAFEREVSDEERRAHHAFTGISGYISYYRRSARAWEQVPGVDVQWADKRRYLRDYLGQVSATEAFGRGSADPQLSARYLAKLRRTPDFADYVFTMLRSAENAVRVQLGLPRVGEGWVSETDLYYRVCKLLEGVEVVHHGRPPWLGRQHLDIWIPSRMLAIEYQGVQHFEPSRRFGGREGLAKYRQLDARKREVCLQHGVRLIEVAYDQPLSDQQLQEFVSVGVTTPAAAGRGRDRPARDSRFGPRG